MTGARLAGLTWDHPRAYRGLEAASALCDGVVVQWERQPLAAFESEPIATLAQRFDLLVIDHPGLGAAVRAGALAAVDEVFDSSDLSAWRENSLGPTWQSYTIEGRTWALPLDASTQACVVRPDLLESAPTDWSDVHSLAGHKPVALCLAGPHAGLMLLALAADRGSDGGRRLLDTHRAVAALGLLRSLWRRVDREASLLDPIALHDLMATTDEIACCPLTYTYASYGSPRTERRLAWAPAPAVSTGELSARSTLGGTGLAVSRRGLSQRPFVATLVRQLMDPAVQQNVVAPLGGQPASRSVWDAGEVDRGWNAHYSSTRASLESAYVRPRYDGWIDFQRELSERVRETLRSRTSIDTVVEQLEHDFLQSRGGIGSGSL